MKPVLPPHLTVPSSTDSIAPSTVRYFKFADLLGLTQPADNFCSGGPISSGRVSSLSLDYWVAAFSFIFTANAFADKVIKLIVILTVPKSIFQM